MPTNVHGSPIQNRIDWLMALSRSHSAQFCDTENSLLRQRYLAEHPTCIVVLKCMDGRIHLPYATKTPLGIIRPFRNLGGIFDLGWPYLGDLLDHQVMDAIKQGQRALIMITYHFSKGERARGCAGFNCDKDAAIDHAQAIKAQVETIFGTEHKSVYPLVCGFETDEDALILHNSQSKQLRLAELQLAHLVSLPQTLADFFPDMPTQVLHDLLPLVQGNIEHIDEIRHLQRQLNIEHREWIMCVGRGFDFLHVPNIALIIGPFSPNLSEPIAQAAGIIQSNMAEGRIPDDGFLLLSSAPFDEVGPDKSRAELKAHFMARFAANVILEAQPSLAEKMLVRTATLHWPTRRLDIIA